MHTHKEQFVILYQSSSSTEIRAKHEQLIVTLRLCDLHNALQFYLKFNNNAAPLQPRSGNQIALIYTYLLWMIIISIRHLIRRVVIWSIELDFFSAFVMNSFPWSVQLPSLDFIQFRCSLNDIYFVLLYNTD